MAAFFKESMRREAITGIKIVFALRSVSRCQSRSYERLFYVKGVTYIAGTSWTFSWRNDLISANPLMIVEFSPTGVTNKNSRDKSWAEHMSVKYFVASRRMLSKILGIVRCLPILGLLAMITIIENARTSTVP